MDRFSIIQRQVFKQTIVDETSSCDPDQCACDDSVANEKKLLKKKDMFQVALITIAAFIGALTINANMTSENMPSTKITGVVSCSSKSDSSDDQLPKDRNNKNTCSHQQGSLCESNNLKRKHLRPLLC